MACVIYRLVYNHNPDFLPDDWSHGSKPSNASYANVTTHRARNWNHISQNGMKSVCILALIHRAPMHICTGQVCRSTRRTLMVSMYVSKIDFNCCLTFNHILLQIIFNFQFVCHFSHLAEHRHQTRQTVSKFNRIAHRNIRIPHPSRTRST